MGRTKSISGRSASHHGSGRGDAGRGSGTTVAAPAKNVAVAASDKDTLSKKYVCGYCLRTGADPNNCPNRWEGEFLKFANTTQCLPCRNLLNGPMAGVDAARLRKEVRIPAKHAKYMEPLAEMEKVIDATTGQLKKALTDVTIPEFVHQLKQTSSNAVKKLMHWWPESACVRESVEYAADQLHEHEGESELGIWRDAKHGFVSGVVCHDVTKSDINVHGKELSHSSRSVVENEQKDLHTRMSKKARTAISVVTSASGEAKMTREAKQKNDDEDSWGDDCLPSAGVEIVGDTSSARDNSPPLHEGSTKRRKATGSKVVWHRLTFSREDRQRHKSFSIRPKRCTGTRGHTHALHMHTCIRRIPHTSLLCSVLPTTPPRRLLPS